MNVGDIAGLFIFGAITALTVWYMLGCFLELADWLKRGVGILKDALVIGLKAAFSRKHS